MKTTNEGKLNFWRGRNGSLDGHYTIDRDPVKFKTTDKATLNFFDEEREAIFRYDVEADRVDIGVMDGVLFVRFLSMIDLLNNFKGPIFIKLQRGRF